MRSAVCWLDCMNANFSIPQGELPKVDMDLGTTNSHLTRIIRQRVLEGKYPPDSKQEIAMVRDFKVSKMTVTKFLKRFYPCIFLAVCLTGCHSVQWEHEPKDTSFLGTWTNLAGLLRCQRWILQVPGGIQGSRTHGQLEIVCDCGTLLPV